ncbi:MFS transporter [Cryptosporangium aurantiacum]|uniref:Predicted arabinose efflux permease, MFS family n=1 Tax=Cryptosporangium aurantiacum TaxID=134849 RepID=A0A1M7RA39_9ACTN|nr:MFS transporter [Cryptosporangium aurantiacum]SHN43187.1 Predicted arabinose efflux permease, MFS family [Cryptosporangium aurantiacum]
MSRNEWSLPALWLATALGGLAQTLAGVAATLLAGELTVGVAAAGLPQTLQVLGAAGSAPLIAAWSRRRGRGAGLGLGAAAAAVGCAVLSGAAVLASLPLVLIGSLLTGAGAAAVALARYAAVDLARTGSAARAVSSVLAAVSVGAVIGPNLLAPTAGLAGAPAFSATFLTAAVVFVGAAVGWAVAAGRRRPDREATMALARNSRARRSRLRGQPVVAVAVLSVANLVMVATMTMAPVQLHHAGAGLGLVGVVVSVHIAAMFAPAPLSARLIDRAGIGGGALAACVVLLAATSIAAWGADSPVALTLAVALLGLGWSAAVVAGSAALVGRAAPDDRPRLEATGEVGMGLAAAVGGALSGVLVGAGGYPLLALAGSACVAGVLVPLSLRLPGKRVPRTPLSTSVAEWDTSIRGPRGTHAASGE